MCCCWMKSLFSVVKELCVFKIHTYTQIYVHMYQEMFALECRVLHYVSVCVCVCVAMCSKKKNIVA